jgi:sulfoxide reductase heme-binding subunit YedZ
MEDFTSQIYWFIGRGTGIAAMVLAGLSVATGLLAGRGRPLKLKGVTEKKELHEALSWATIVAIIAHGVFLALDPWLNAGVVGVLVPFTIDYRPFFTGIGVIAAWGLVLLGLSYYIRTWIGTSRWRVAHRFTALFWIFGLVHTFGAGTDASQPWLWIPVALTSIPAFVLLIARFVKRPPKAPAGVDPAAANKTATQ